MPYPNQNYGIKDNPLIVSVYSTSTNDSGNIPPGTGDFLLLDGTFFLLLDGTNLLLL